QPPRCLRTRFVPSGRQAEWLGPEAGRGPPRDAQAHDRPGAPRTLRGLRGARRGLEAIHAVPEGSREPAPGPASTRVRSRRSSGGPVDVRNPVGPGTEGRSPGREGPTPPGPHENAGRGAAPGDPPPVSHGCGPFPGRSPGDHECGDEPAKPRTGPLLVLRQEELGRAVSAVRGVRVPYPSARGDRPGLYDSRGGEGRAAVLRSPRGSGGPPDGPADRGEDPGERRLAEERSEEHTSELQSLAYLVCRLLLESCRTPPDLHSFPTRRSSDLSAVRGVRVPYPSARGDRPGLYDSRGGEGRAAVLRSPRGSGGPPDGPADRGEDPGERRLAEE